MNDSPSLNEIRSDFITLHTRNFDAYMVGRSLTSEQEFYGAQFDRALAEHDRQVAERAWDAAIAMVAPDDVDILYAACPYRAAKGEQK